MDYVQVLSTSLHRGRRPAHVHKGSPSNWRGLVVSCASRNGDAEREAEQRRGHEKSECRHSSADTGELTRGTQPSQERHRSMEP